MVFNSAFKGLKLLKKNRERAFKQFKWPRPQCVKALRCKPIGRGFDSRWFHRNYSDRTMALGSAQPLTEISTRNISWGGKGGRCIEFKNLPYWYADFYEIWGTLTSPNPQGFSRPVMGLLYVTEFSSFNVWRQIINVTTDCSYSYFTVHGLWCRFF
jgi:hypothetical protein